MGHELFLFSMISSSRNFDRWWFLFHPSIELCSTTPPFSFCVFFELQPGLSIFEVYQRYESCGESSVLVFMKSTIKIFLIRRHVCLHPGSILHMLCSHKGVLFFTLQMIFYSSPGLTLIGPVYICFLKMYPTVVFAKPSIFDV